MKMQALLTNSHILLNQASEDYEAGNTEVVKAQLQQLCNMIAGELELPPGPPYEEDN